MKSLVFKFMAFVSLLLAFNGCGDSGINTKSGDDYLSLELKNVDGSAELTIQAKTDLIIHSVSVNRGKCPIGFSPMENAALSTMTNSLGPFGKLIETAAAKYTLDKDLPLELEFSQSIVVPMQCNANSVLETAIETNQGTFTWTWSK
ncbi:hypothetical protein [Helicobacter sp.]|uniref:hypothetical protein n=1 Tax=Helicobacter sp. TaxID=218 RepID=UPI002A911F9A|nr:hypothetical protein [Helicobacter sp.]MDY5557812.1 hypothetical protein [Helicobacter sp.]